MKYLITLMSLLFLMGCVSVSPRSTVRVDMFPSSNTIAITETSPTAPVAVTQSVESTPMDKLVAQVLEKRIASDSAIPPVNDIREYSDREVMCMAKALYFEAGGEKELGVRAVGFAIVNRSQHKQYPKTICGVVNQRSKYGCQFSWVCDRKSDSPANAQLYAHMREVALLVLYQQVDNPVGRAISFHNPTVRPSWARRMTYIRRIGGHFFYA